MKYFKKENLRSEVRDRDNKLVVFIPIYGVDGVLEVDEAVNLKLVEDLNALAEKRVGGVIKISEDVYDSLKKNSADWMTSHKPSHSTLNQVRVSPNQESFAIPVAPPAAVVASGITIMDEPPPPSSIGAFRARARPVKPLEPAR